MRNSVEGQPSCQGIAEGERVEPADQPRRDSEVRPQSSRERVAKLRAARRQAEQRRMKRLLPLVLLPLALLLFWPMLLGDTSTPDALTQPAPTTALQPAQAVAAAFTPAATPNDEAASAVPEQTAVPTATLPIPSLTPTRRTLVPTAEPGSITSVPILMYHYVREVNRDEDPLGYGLSVTPAQFAEQLTWLAQNGYTPVRIDKALQCLRGEANCPQRPVALTFDDGYEDAYTEALPLLRKHGFVATFYIITDFVGLPGYMNAEQLRNLQQAGMELGAHSISHPDLTILGTEDARQEIAGSRERLAELSAGPVTSFCYPSGIFNDETVALVEEAGYENAVTTVPDMGFDNPFLLPRLRVEGDTTLDGFIWMVEAYSSQVPE